jgi:hypothetical protein
MPLPLPFETLPNTTHGLCNQSRVRSLSFPDLVRLLRYYLFKPFKTNSTALVTFNLKINIGKTKDLLVSGEIISRRNSPRRISSLEIDSSNSTRLAHADSRPFVTLSKTLEFRRPYFSLNDSSRAKANAPLMDHELFPQSVEILGKCVISQT